MANVYKQVAAFGNNQIIAEVQYNDANGKMGAGRVTNNSDQPAHMWVELNPPINGWSTFGLDAPANQVTEVNFPNNVAAFWWDDTGNPDYDPPHWALPEGISIFCQWPA